jgi:hypothetical protein
MSENRLTIPIRVINVMAPDKALFLSMFYSTNLANTCQASFSISVYKKDVSKQTTAVADPSEKYNNVARSIYRVP